MIARTVNKGWGREVIFASTDEYAGKILVFDDKGCRMSLHFHAEKDETWYVLDGIFEIEYLDTHKAEKIIGLLEPGDVWHNRPFLPHRLTCLSEGGGRLVEVSTFDSPMDNYRIAPGDSQR